MANIGIFTIGLFTLSKNARSATNVLFGLICLSLIGWTTANFYSLHLHHPENIFGSIKVIFAFVVLQNASFLMFTKVFPSSRIYQSGWWDRLYVLAGFLLMVAAADGLYFRGYTYQDRHFSILPSPFISLFIAFAVVSIGTGLWRLVSRYKKARGVLRNQLLYLLIASILLLVLIPITNFLLPIAFSNNTFVAYSPIYTLLFTAIIGYAVVRQKLFDIRLVVATSAAYVMSLATLGIIYGVFIYILSQIVLGQPKTNLTSEIPTVAVVVLLAFLF
ncbi:MAG TPA: histidine kinase N-terminal 7TM domain-containing protein, partial [Candidatus Saccharimonadales bacterium]|nr:histidine kinase N-terminal 7TM domain-containing protein [Candidatus Saccharimonadales bacterium]